MPDLVNKQKTNFLGKRDKHWNMSKTFPYFEVSYKFRLKSVKSLKEIFWIMEYWFMALECQIWSTNTKNIFAKTRQTLEIIKNFLLLLQFPINSSWRLPKPWIESSGPWNDGLTPFNAKFCRRWQNQFSGKAEQIL